jgi:hypothetical protein
MLFVLFVSASMIQAPSRCSQFPPALHELNSVHRTKHLSSQTYFLFVVFNYIKDKNSPSNATFLCIQSLNYIIKLSVSVQSVILSRRSYIFR